MLLDIAALVEAVADLKLTNADVDGVEADNVPQSRALGRS
jgi:hypothetical protein